jgi:hypothetical protein
LSVTHGTAAGQKALAAAAAETAEADLPAAGRRRLLAESAPAAPPAGDATASLTGNATAELANQLTVCAGGLQGLGLIGSNVCMVASTQLPLPPDYIWYDPFDTGSSSAGGWPAWQSAVVALAVALPVLAAVSFVFVTVKRRRGRKYMQHQLPAKEAATDSMSEGVEGATNSNGSSGAAGMRSSKEQLLTYAAATSVQGSNAQQQQQQWQQWRNPASKLSAGAVSRNSVLVDMGVQIASQAGTAAPAGASMMSQQQQQQQQQRPPVGANQQQRLAGAISIVSAGLQARRLGGISNNRSASATESNAAAATAGAGASLSRKGSPGSGSGAAAGAVASRQQMQQRLVQLSIDEDNAPADHQQWNKQEPAEAPYGSTGTPDLHSTRTAAANAPAGGRSNRPPTTAATAAAVARVNQAAAQQLQLHEPIGQGTFGVVFRATWRGIPSAVKLMQLPAAVGESLESAGLAAGAGAGGRGSSSREQMAVMEAAVGASINHPNVVQVRSLHRVDIH